MSDITLMQCLMCGSQTAGPVIRAALQVKCTYKGQSAKDAIHKRKCADVDAGPGDVSEGPRGMLVAPLWPNSNSDPSPRES